MPNRNLAGDLKHWYDGWFYETFISGNNSTVFKVIEKNIEEGKSVVDLACGPGAFSFMIAGKVSKVLGVDLSSVNIERANYRKRKLNISNAEFEHGDVLNLDGILSEKYDYAVISFGLHEMPPEMRSDVIAEMRRAASYVWIADYNIPLPGNLSGMVSYLAEFFAGREHFRNFKDYSKGGGMKGMLADAGVKADKNIRRGTFHIAGFPGLEKE